MAYIKYKYRTCGADDKNHAATLDEGIYLPKNRKKSPRRDARGTTEENPSSAIRRKFHKTAQFNGIVLFEGKEGRYREAASCEYLVSVPIIVAWVVPRPGRQVLC